MKLSNMDFKQLKDSMSGDDWVWFNGGSAKEMKCIDSGVDKHGLFHVVSVPRYIHATAESHPDVTFLPFKASGTFRNITIDDYDGPWHLQAGGFRVVDHRGELGFLYDRDVSIVQATGEGVYQQWGGVLNYPREAFIVGNFEPEKKFYTIRYEHLNHVFERDGRGHVRYS